MVGASPSTVSFVLNGKASQMRISESLTKKIQSVAKKAGYHPNQVAVSLRTGQSKILGLLIESIGGHFFGSLARVIEEEAERFGYRIVYCSTENDTKKGREMIRMLSQSQVDGYLITPAQGMEKDIASLIDHKKPVVLMDGYFKEMKVPYVTVDNFEGVTRGMQHLIDKGYKKIGFVTVELDLIQIREREEAYTKSLKSNKIEADKNLIFRLKYNYDKEEAVQQLSSFIKNTPGLEAIFFAANYLGITGLQSIRRLNLRVPEDIAVVCFDDHDIFSLYPPGITSIQQPVEEIGKTAIQLLIGQLTKQKPQNSKNQIQLPATFVERGST